MKVIDLALKDLLRSMRSAAFWVFAFAVPLLFATIFYFAFGGLASDDSEAALPITRVQVANLDDPGGGAYSVGATLIELLKSEELVDLIYVTETAAPTAARAAVDAQEAQVAVLIPAGFTEAVLSPDGRAVIELYQDPTLTLGPGIVKGLVSQLVDGFTGVRITAGVTHEQLTARGVAVNDALLGEVAMGYGEWVAALGQDQSAGSNPMLQVQTLSGRQESGDARVNIVSMVMAGMMVFYVFLTGATSAQSILQEEEGGTLARLFTTPTPQSAILGGKLFATFLTLAIQVLVLVIVSALIFGIDWGPAGLVLLVTIGLVVLAAGFGILITSFLKNTKQAGIVYGGVMTVLGMIGMMDVFTGGTANLPPAMDVIALLIPQGWGVRGWQLLLEGGDPSDVIITAAVALALGAIFFTLGVRKFRHRFEA